MGPGMLRQAAQDPAPLRGRGESRGPEAFLHPSGPLQRGLGVALPPSDPGEGHWPGVWSPWVPFKSGRGEGGRRCWEAPHAPGEPTAHTRRPLPGRPGWARQAPPLGSRAPAGTHWLLGLRGVVAAAPSGSAPIWRGRGTNQPPGAGRPGGWALIDTRWPLPRGRLGGGSAGWEAKPWPVQAPGEE